MISTFKLVFSNFQYIILAGIIFTGFMFSLLFVSEFIFLEPYIAGHIPSGTEFSFLLILTLSVLAAIVLPMNVYRIIKLRSSKKNMSGGIFGSIVGAAAGACGCGPVGFAIISTLGSVGGVATIFLTNYEIPIRIGAIALLVFTYYTTARSLEIECKIR